MANWFIVVNVTAYGSSVRCRFNDDLETVKVLGLDGTWRWLP